jgi:predicted transposase YdaD
MAASDKLFYWVFQRRPDRILELVPDLAAGGGGYRFSAPVLKERERRLDGLLQPPDAIGEQPPQPAVILEAQMQADQGFLRRLYAESAMLIEQEAQIEHWRVVVLCPNRKLNFGRPLAVAEFLRERVQWIELEPAATDPTAPPLLRALALLVQPEAQIPASSAEIRAEVAGTAQEQELADVIAATLISRFNGRSISQLCAMGSITVDEFTQSVAYREIFGQGRQEGRQEGLQEGEAREATKVTLRLLNRRCGPLSEATTAQIQALPLEQLEALADALLDFQGPADLAAWLATNT